MGCDIHMHVEVKTRAGKWAYHGRGYLDRNYHIFCLIAGVRCGYADSPKPLFSAKGLPGDVTKKTRQIYDHDEATWAHNASWLSSDETRIAAEAMLEGDRAEWVSAFPPLAGDGWVDFRLVFWFDS